LTGLFGTAIIALMDKSAAIQILLNEINNTVFHDERTLIVATRIWMSKNILNN
jgi:hypothetical protein